MKYHPPADFVSRLKNIEAQYTHQNPDRLFLISSLKAILKYADEAELEEDLNEQLFIELLVGITIFCIIYIEKDLGYIHRHSQLKDLLTTALDINKDNILDNHEKLIYLKSFAKFIETNLDNYELMAFFHEQNLSYENFNLEVGKTLTLYLELITKELKAITQSIPLEQVIDKKIACLAIDYQQKKRFFRAKENSQRVFLIQLAEAISVLQPANNLIGSSEVSPSEIIKIGALIYFMESINSEYYFSSPTRSRLYECCQEILKKKDLSDFNDETKIICLLAFKNFIANQDNLVKLEQFGKTQFTDKNLLMARSQTFYQISSALDKKLQALLASTNISFWGGTIIGGLTGLALAPAGYGAGAFIGHVFGQSNVTIPAKLILSTGLNQLGIAYFGETGGFLGFMAADKIVQSVLKRAFAKVFESIALIGGFATGAVVGFVVFDLSVAGLKSLCKWYVKEAHKLDDPFKLQRTDPKFIEFLLSLPDKEFSLENKNAINALMDQPVQTKSVTKVTAIPELTFDFEAREQMDQNVMTINC